MTKQNARREELRQQMWSLCNEVVKNERAAFTKFSIICGRVFFNAPATNEDFFADDLNTDCPRFVAAVNGDEYPVDSSVFGNEVLAMCRRLWVLFEELEAIENAEQLVRNKARVEELRAEYEKNAAEIISTSSYFYSDFRHDVDGVFWFKRNGGLIRVYHNGMEYRLVNHDGLDRVYFGRLPRRVQDVIRYAMALRGNIKQLERTIKEAEEEEAGAPVEELEDYDVCAAIHTKTLAQRVRERCQMEAGELPPFTPETMPECDSDLIDDINQALEEIDADNVCNLLKYADDSENEGRKAKAAAYRKVARLAAVFAIDDAIEEEPELEDLLGALFDWGKPAALPTGIAKGIAEALDSAAKVIDVSCLSPDDLSERTRVGVVANWSCDTDYFRNMDDDLVRAFSLMVDSGLWIEYFNNTWAFTNDGVVDASSGAFASQPAAFVETLSRFLGPCAEDLY